MIDMTMGEEDLLDRHALLRGCGLEPVEIAARIDKGAPHGLRAPKQGAVLLERRDRDDGCLDRGIAHSWQMAAIWRARKIGTRFDSGLSPTAMRA